jgi:4'-phosphopantetheinyl transferase
MLSDTRWSMTTKKARGEWPEGRTVDVWVCSCDAPDDILHTYLQSLDQEEKARAASFRVSRAWSEFVARRAVVRVVASRYVGDRSGVWWGTGPLGKPFLMTEAALGHLEFSWSQAGRAVVVAVAAGLPVGVDACVESEAGSLDGAIGTFCAEDEALVLERLAKPRSAQALAQCWTAKEACLKAVGTGLYCDPRRLRTWGDNGPLGTVEWHDGPDGKPGHRMYVAHRSVSDGIGVAVAAPVPPDLAMQYLEWNGGGHHGRR